MLSAKEALAKLIEGNERFTANVRSLDALLSHTRRGEMTEGQAPFAIILGCSDSRVPAEIVFDQGLGDLFVVRVAGNIVAPSQIGSVEFAAETFGTRLVVVMGHTQCGAIEVTLDSLLHPEKYKSQNVASITQRIRPAVEALMHTNLAQDHDALVREAVRANVRASTNHLRHGSAILEKLIDEQQLLVVGAEYDLETGKVEFFDGV